jgi:rhamnosyl/mannosyltransferase
MRETIRVLHVYKTSLPESTGGVEVFIDMLCRVSAKYGVKSNVLSLTKHPSENSIEMQGYTVYQAKQDLFIASTGFSLSAFKKFKKLACEADVIHYHFPNPFADILHFICRIKKPSLVTYHSDIIRQKWLLKLYRPLMRLFLNAVDHIVATSPNYRNSSEVLQNYRNKTSIIPVGIDVNMYPKLNQNKLDYWRKRLCEPFYLFIGAMRYYKGLHIALDAIKHTNIRLVIAGINGIEKELKQHATKYNISNVDFLGFISDEDKVALLTLCYGFVFPSHLRSEAFGLALLEAAAFGKPLISCEIGTGTSYININNQTGFVITPSSPDELKSAMQHLLDNPERAAEMGKNAKKRSGELFTADKQTKAYCELYDKLLQE